MVSINIDRFEEDYAVCEDAQGLNQRLIHRGELPENAKEGDTLVYTNNQWRIDTDTTNARQQRINDIFNRIKRRN